MADGRGGGGVEALSWHRALEIVLCCGAGNERKLWPLCVFSIFSQQTKVQWKAERRVEQLDRGAIKEHSLSHSQF